MARTLSPRPLGREPPGGGPPGTQWAPCLSGGRTTQPQTRWAPRALCAARSAVRVSPRQPRCRVRALSPPPHHDGLRPLDRAAEATGSSRGDSHPPQRKPALAVRRRVPPGPWPPAATDPLPVCRFACLGYFVQVAIRRVVLCDLLRSPACVQLHPCATRPCSFFFPAEGGAIKTGHVLFVCPPTDGQAGRCPRPAAGNNAL